MHMPHCWALSGVKWGGALRHKLCILVRCMHSFSCRQQSWPSSFQKELRPTWVAPTKHPWPWGK